MTRAGVLIVIGAAALFVIVLVTGIISEVVIGGEQAAANFANASCDATLGPFGGVDATVGANQAGQLTPEQRNTVSMIIAIGKQRNLPSLAWQVAIQAGMQESGLRNVGYGDLAGPDSRGIFQMRPSQGWGSPDQVMDPSYEINKFYDVLTQIPNWKQQQPGANAQDVEKSAFPLAYNKWEPMAAELIKNIGQVSDPTGCGVGFGNLLPAPSAAAAKAIAFALSQVGKPYVWGATGPDSYDCSGLMLRAYQAAGINLPRVSVDQYHAGALLPAHAAQPGDLLFLAYDPSNPDTIHHVFMYLGNNQLVEAPYQGHPVHQTTINWNDPQLVPQAVRPGV